MTDAVRDNKNKRKACDEVQKQMRDDVVQRIQDLENSLAELSCPCCTHTPTTVENLQQCQNAHPICSDCLQKLPIQRDGGSTCPICRVSISRSPQNKIRVSGFSSLIDKYNAELSTVSAMCTEEQVLTEFICIGCSQIITHAVLEFANGNPQGSWMEAQKHMMECKMFREKCDPCKDNIQSAWVSYMSGFQKAYGAGWKHAASGIFIPYDHQVHCLDVVFEQVLAGYTLGSNRGYLSGYQDAKTVMSSQSFSVTDGLILYRWQVRYPAGLWLTPCMDYQDEVSRVFRNSADSIVTASGFTIDFKSFTQTGPYGIQMIRLLRTVRSQDLPSHRYPGGSDRISPDTLIWQFEVRR